ncbi:MAG: cation diffusion facilitator family transporter [Nitrincola sp.]|nr:cation diffusion facilitator family transporter [Nitrincola sp.]
MRHNPNEKKVAAQRISVIGALVNSFLSVIKIIGGFLTGSAALVADGFHSLSDVATDMMVIFLVGVSHKKPDKEHPWGHGRFETLGTVFLAVILLLVAGLMTWDSLKLLFSGEIPAPPAWPALVIAAISILANELLFIYTLKVGKANQSNLIIANAWHHRTDSLSSIVVLFALAGAMLGVWWLDALAAVLVALLIGKIGVDLLLKSLAELVDTGLPPERIEALQKTARETDGVIDVHHVRTRLMGGQSLLEIHIQVAPHISASEGHYIGDSVCEALKEEFDDISYIIYHIDTYDDEEVLAADLPKLASRREIQQVIDMAFSDLLGDIPEYHLSIYYSKTSFAIEIKLPDNRMLITNRLSNDQLQHYLNETFSTIKGYRSISIWTSTDTLEHYSP